MPSSIYSEKEITRISKLLSLVLRHRPEVIGIELDPEGWTLVDKLLKQLNDNGTEITSEMLQHVVETNTKKRFAFNNDRSRIRASQGHSIDIELGYIAQSPPETLFHGTAQRFLESILEMGLTKQSRQHVHLSTESETAVKVGERHGKPIVLKIMAGEMHRAGYQFFLSANQVWLTDFVPTTFLNKE